MQIIPAIDLLQGQCVRLLQGDFTQQTTYPADPLAMARRFERAGLRRLHLVDLDGAKAGKVQQASILQQLATSTNLQIDFGGGIANANDLRMVLAAGATQVNIGTLAVLQPALFQEWLSEFGAQRVILSADVRKEQIAIKGWQEQSNLSIFELLDRYLPLGLRYVACTDISKDGQMQGSSMDLYEKLLLRYPSIKLIASGGIHNLDELAALRKLGCYGAILGKAIYEGQITLSELADFQNAQT